MKSSEKLLNAPELRINQSEAFLKLALRIRLGKSIIAGDYDSSHTRDEFFKWHDYNRTLLQQMFNSLHVANEYNEGLIFIYESGTVIDSNEIIENIKRAVRRLESIHDRLELYAPTVPNFVAATPLIPSSDSREIFIVHGRNND